MAKEQNIGKTFTDEVVELDNGEFVRCTFTRCTVVYSGGELPALVDNHFAECKWEFDGASARTLAFLTALHSAGGDTRRLVEQTIQNLTSGLYPS